MRPRHHPVPLMIDIPHREGRVDGRLIGVCGRPSQVVPGEPPKQLVLGRPLVIQTRRELVRTGPDLRRRRIRPRPKRPARIVGQSVRGATELRLDARTALAPLRRGIPGESRHHIFRGRSQRAVRLRRGRGFRDEPDPVGERRPQYRRGPAVARHIERVSFGQRVFVWGSGGAARVSAGRPDRCGGDLAL